ncbi:MAG: amidohydrolase family protein [Rhodospirillaceae bacterium]|nr:amidohydrolase family protein [Rhodospirillaceae bacterium]
MTICARVLRHLLRLAWALSPAIIASGANPAMAQSAPSLVIVDVTLIDGTGRSPMPGMAVAVTGNRITFVGSAAAAPAGGRRIDGRGKVLIPGLMDMHLHVIGGGAWKDSSAQSGKTLDFEAGIRSLQGYLYYGFTSIYDAGNNPDFILPLRARERAGEIVAPRIFATGQLLTYPGSWSVGYAGIAVRDWPDTMRDLDLQISRKPDLQKITYEAHGAGPNPLIPKLPKELMAKEIEYLRAHGIRTTAHIANELMARDAIEAGIDTLAHAPSVGLVTEDFARMVAAKKVPIQTSLAVFDEISQMETGVEFLKTPEYAATVTAQEVPVREASRQRYLKLGWPVWFKTILPYAKRNLKMIHQAGGILVLGTDRAFAPTAHREMTLLVEAGIAPLDVITIASLNGAIFLAKEQDLGSVETGKLADLVLLDADPTADIANVKQVSMVIKDGAIIDRAALDLPINRAARKGD